VFLVTECISNMEMLFSSKLVKDDWLSNFKAVLLEKEEACQSDWDLLGDSKEGKVVFESLQKLF